MSDGLDLDSRRPVVRSAMYLLILIGITFSDLLPPAYGRAGPPGTAAEESRIRACISQHAEGHAWLEWTLLALRLKEGGWLGARVRNSNGSHDLGPMQVNDWWVKKLVELTGRETTAVSRWLQYDPCFNVATAKWIFLSGLQQTGDFWRAVGVYHSPTAHRQLDYARDVSVILSDLVRVPRH